MAKLQLIEQVVEKYRRALRAEIDAQMTAPTASEAVPQPGPVTRIMKRDAAPAKSEPLQAPGRIDAAASNCEVALGWSGVPGAALYAVKRASSPGGPYTTIARPAQNFYADTNLQNGSACYYIVVPLDAGGAEGPGSIEVQATPMAPPLAPAFRSPGVLRRAQPATSSCAR